MADKFWDVLGIEPTVDETAIRRAYAKCLKVIDVDSDPATFMYLRQAYEDALADARDTKAIAGTDGWEIGDDGQLHFSPEAYIAQLDAGSGSDAEDDRAARDYEDTVTDNASYLRLADLAFREFEATFEVLLDVGEMPEAMKALRRALAQGAVPIGSEIDLVQDLMSTALLDNTVTPDTMEEIASAFDGAPVLSRNLHERAAAERWYATVAVDAKRCEPRLRLPPRLYLLFLLFDPGFLRRITSRRLRVAFAVYHPDNTDLLSRDLPALRAEVEQAQRHKKWLEGRLDVEALTAKLVKLEETLRRQEFIAVIGGLILIILIALQWWLRSTS